MPASPHPDLELSEEITELLNRWSSGEDPHMEALIPKIYDNLCHMARHHLKGERRGTLLQTQALVNEVYLQLERSDCFHFQNRAHFFAWVSKIMRNLLIKYARRKNAQKRDHRNKIPLNTDGNHAEPSSDPTRLLALDQALERLARRDPRSAQVVELRFFGGLRQGEICKVLGVSKTTVARDWEFAKRWLSKELGSTDQARGQGS